MLRLPVIELVAEFKEREKHCQVTMPVKTKRWKFSPPRPKTILTKK
jgi:hypothetical protein